MKGNRKIFSILSLTGLVIMAACTPELVQIKGKYNDSPIEITSVQQTDSVWLKLTTLLSIHGLLVKKIDKVKGLLTSKESAFIAYTFEDDNGKLIQPQAWVVLNKAIVNGKQWYPKAIYSQWNIQVNVTMHKPLIERPKWLSLFLSFGKSFRSALL